MHLRLIQAPRCERRTGTETRLVPEEREAEITIRKQIEQLVQLNEGQPYTYERTALIKMLDDALAQARPRTQ
jgi:hypothetical protein